MRFPLVSTTMPTLNRKLIARTLNATRDRIFTFAGLSDLFQENIAAWTPSEADKIPDDSAFQVKDMNVHAVVEALLKARLLEKAVLPFPYRGDTRYLLGDVDPLDLVQSLNQEGYFTHFTAIFLNDLTEQTPKTVYFNIEQRLTGGDGQLTQEALDRAFKAQPRLSSNVVEYKGIRIVKVNGRNTHQLGVVTKNRSHAGALRLTDVERTLIDATVRPAYSGGIAVVAKAFELAKPLVSVKKLAAYLRKLNYVYPYHQAIGFYMERAGYDKRLLTLLEDFPIEYDFYLQHAMRSPVLNNRWRLYVPKGF